MTKNWTLARREKTLRQRAKIIQEIRRFFVDRGYLEVETPHRIPAPVPESYINAIPSGEWYLHTSPEICMKRMLAAGYEKVFQICRCWREGERGSQHIPEFTLLEWYRSGCDYIGLMEECEELIQTVASAIGLGDQIVYRGQKIDLGRPWERISVKEVFERYSPFAMGEALEQDVFDEIMVRDIEPRLGIEKPTFIYDYPAARRALARLKQEDRTLAERFELYIGGLELANAFSELIDPEEQREHFLRENENRQAMGKPVYPLPEKFLEDLEDMPPSAGIALGVDRLVMVLLDVTSIDEVVAFTPEEL
ncbi:MAG: EF-P lysine aminoacylase GenX [Syntrophaceae bacterium]|nr:EF-P lysine aminoacylase GenX [Syntrophaceae bacterium]